MEHQDLPLLSDQHQSQLRSGIAKLLYLSINTRPDIALRIGRFDSDDEKKFLRVLYYLNETPELAIKLQCDDDDPIHVFTDASDRIRSIDRRFQTGVVQLGQATLIARSRQAEACDKVINRG
jgi:hypothetical protein